MNWSKWLWRVKAKLYDTLRPGFMLKAENEAVLSLLQQIPQNSIHRVLDVGTGTGNSYYLLDAYSVFKVGIDTSPAMLNKNPYKSKLVNGDILAAPFRPDTFDLVLCIGVSEYSTDLAFLLRKLNLLLSGKGFLVFTISPKNSLNFLRMLSGHRLFLCDDTSVKTIINETGFKIVKKTGTMMQVQYLLLKTSFLNKHFSKAHVYN